MFEVAIVGIGCRFPGGATNPAEFWHFLVTKGDGMSEVPADRWSLERFYDPDPDAPGRMYVRQGGFLAQSPWEFDPEYFGISPREAAIMDPQQRLLLEVAVEALDDAGMNGSVAGREVGVYIGGFTSDNQVARHSPASRSAINSHTATSGTFTMLSNRLSYVLDLHGPSMTIDTACSSSMVAIHEAAQAIARGECDVALAGGVNSMIAPETFVSMCKGRFLAADGRCKTFDASADGYARGEGSGVIVLKPLATAQADGDRIYAVIRATGANQDGRTSGITVPNPLAQAALAERVLAQSGLAASDIGYVEAHGTGTAIGDPVEIQALGQTYGNVAGRHTPLVVGSVKAAIGHTEAASGVAGVIKAALTVYHRTIAPQAWLRELNPAIPFAEHRIEIPTEVRAFPPAYRMIAAAANGFGYGGTNAHVVMVAAPDPDAAGGPTPVLPSSENHPSVRVLPVSGRTDAAARAAAAALLAQLDATDGLDAHDLDALAAAAWGRRLHHPMRTAFAFTDGDDLRAGLTAFAAGEGRAASRVVTVDGDQPVFVFSGMGPQWWAMGRELLQREGPFRRTALEIDAVFLDIAGWSIVEALLADETDSRVTRTEVAQPANFVVQIGLAAELKALGIEPAAILGHSVGEVSAAYLSGALSLHDALVVSYHRARLQATTAGTGGMVAVGLSEAEALTWLSDGSVPSGTVSVAAVNSPSAVTLAGDSSVLGQLSDRLTAAGIFARALRVEVPYHSHLMDPILAEVRGALAGVQPRLSRVPLYSSVTAKRVTGAEWDAGYWVDNVRQPVRFAAAIDGLIADGHRVFLEVGPHPVLGGNIREILVRGGENGAVVATLSRSQPDLTSLGQTVAELYSAGALGNRPPGAPAGPVAHAPLPTYPWQRVRVWSEADASAEDRLGDPTLPPMLGRRTSSAAPEWETDLSVSALPWLFDHVVDGLVLLPGTGFVDAALSASAQLGRPAGQSLADVRFASPRIVEPHDVPVLRIGIEPSTNRFTIDSRRGTDPAWVANVSGRIVDGRYAPGTHDFSPPVDATHVTGADLYPRLDARGLSYGPAFRGIVEAWVGTDRVVARVDASEHAATAHLAHPATTDAALQCMAALIAGSPDGPAGAVVPYGIAAVRRHRPLGTDVVVSARRLDRPGLWTDIALADPDGTVALELLGVEFRPVRPEPPIAGQLEPLWYELVWERHGQPADTAGDVDRTDLLVVSLGPEPAPAARALMAAHGSAQLLAIPSTVEGALAPDAGLDITRLLRTYAAAEQPLTVVVVPSVRAHPNGAGGADPGRAGDADDELFDRATGLAGGLLATAKAIQQALDERVLDGGARSSFEVCAVVVTEQAFGVPGDVVPVQLDHAALIGIRRTLRNEQPTLSWRQVDVERSTPAHELVAEVFIARPAADGSKEAGADEGPAVEDEVVLRGGVRLALSLQRNLADYLGPLDVARPLTDPEISFRVEAPDSMLIADLAVREVDRRAPGPDQVEVRVLSAGINYKDSAKVMGLLTERELAGTYFGTDLGMEAIGVVVRVGPGVTRFAVGDRMSIGARDCLSRYLTLDLDRGGVLSLAPTPWADTDAALNLPFLTAHHCLADAARVEAGETVLIHGAAGGVGLAAIQVAKRLGAFVIGTAGSDERRAAVLAAGADHVLDSRSLNFVEEIRALTDGRGVDVVLNSAPGAVIAANLAVAAEFGRVVEIGKADIYGGGVMALAPFDHNLSFIAVDIDRMLAFRRPAVVALVTTVNDAFERGWYTPLPCTVYSVDHVAQAFEAVARGTHVGRVVVDFRDAAPRVRPARPAAVFHPDATYLVTGGFGAFGLATARWLAASGARQVALVGRSGASTVGAEQAVAALEASGVTVVEIAADVSRIADVRAMFDHLAATGRPVRGVFHAAGVLDDRPFTDIDAASLRRVMAPKVAGAINLHSVTTARGIELDHFVTYSSATAITGTVPQSSYAAANTVLDSLVQLRRANGQAALTVNWGALSGGMADSSETVAAYLAAIGLDDVDMGLSARLLEQALALDVTHVGILRIDWARWGATHPASAQTTRFLEHVSAAGRAGSDAARLHDELLALPEVQRLEVVAYMLAEQFAIVLGIPAESIDLDTALPDLGMDSLMAVEMQARVNLALNVEVSALEFGQGGLSSLAARIMPSLLGAPAGPTETVTLGAGV